MRLYGNHRTFQWDNLHITGNHNVVYGANCTVVGDHNVIFGKHSLVQGSYNFVYEMSSRATLGVGNAYMSWNDPRAVNAAYLTGSDPFEIMNAARGVNNTTSVHGFDPHDTNPLVENSNADVVTGPIGTNPSVVASSVNVTSTFRTPPRVANSSVNVPSPLGTSPRVVTSSVNVNSPFPRLANSNVNVPSPLSTNPLVVTHSVNVTSPFPRLANSNVNVTSPLSTNSRMALGAVPFGTALRLAAPDRSGENTRVANGSNVPDPVGAYHRVAVGFNEFAESQSTPAKASQPSKSTARIKTPSREDLSGDVVQDSSFGAECIICLENKAICVAL